VYRLVLSVLLVVVVLVGGYLLNRSSQARDDKKVSAVDTKSNVAAKEEPKGDERALLNDLVAAFNKGDAKALAALWSTKGEYQGTTTPAIRGREAIEKAYTDFFAKNKGTTLEYKSESSRALGEAMAVEEGTFTRKDESGKVIAFCDASLFLSREKGKWVIALLRETGRDPNVSLDSIKFLLGDWTATIEDSVVTTNYSFDENNTFIHGKYRVTQKGKVVRSGLQIIGKDAGDNIIRSWVFDSDGGFSSGVWKKDDNGWIIETDGTTNDGYSTSATNVLTIKDADTFIKQATNRWFDGERQPAGEPIKVTRVKKEK
jgi:uncharacterized protein (TIGR02246 family)